MNTEKRKVSTDALETLGTLIDETAKRDAIHLAVEPVVAGERLLAGQRIGIVNGVASRKAEKILGIVDPFIEEGVVLKGERFWLIVLPRTITSLRHVWSHPEFPDKQESEYVSEKIDGSSERWVSDFAQGIGISYNVLMDAANEWVEYGEYLSLGGLLEGESVPDEFWVHYENITGKSIPENKKGSFFSCSC